MSTKAFHHIHLHSTVAELPLHTLYLPIDAPGEMAANAFQMHPDLPGVIVMDQNIMAGMIPGWGGRMAWRYIYAAR